MSASRSHVAAGARLVVADDDADIRALLDAVLTRAGYRPVLVNDGQAALDAVRQVEPAVIVLDVRMPGLNGLEACRSVKRTPETSAIGVLMVSADASQDDIAAGFAAGADDYLTKPFSPRELVRRVAALATAHPPG
jgi:DNA-binding response OmpR family regulator